MPKIIGQKLAKALSGGVSFAVLGAAILVPLLTLDVFSDEAGLVSEARAGAAADRQRDNSPQENSQRDDTEQPGFFRGVDERIWDAAEEDEVLGVLLRHTDILERTDTSVDSSLADNVARGQAVPDGWESVLELPSVPLEVRELVPGLVRAELAEGTYYVQATKAGPGVFGAGNAIFAGIEKSERHTFRFRLNLSSGEEAEILESNQVLITRGRGENRSVTGTIGAPEAIDARGEELPATQRIEGDFLLIEVDAREASLPAVLL